MDRKDVAELVEEFQCPGCLVGGDTSCSHYEWSDRERRCMGHRLGTMIYCGAGLTTIALGLPKGFHRPGFDFSGDPPRPRTTMEIRLYRSGETPGWDHLNVPVWAMVRGGFLFVRTFVPRLNFGRVDVVKDGTLTLVPNAIDVSSFIDEID